MKIKQAVILCAGLGMRLRPYTDTMPKPMIPIRGPIQEPHSGSDAIFSAAAGGSDSTYFSSTPSSSVAAPRDEKLSSRIRKQVPEQAPGKPMLQWNMEQFKKHGVTEFFFNLHYLPEVIKNYFGDGSKFGVRIVYNFEPKILGTAGGVKAFEGQLDDEFFLIYGDTFSLVDYSKMREAWEKLPPGVIGMQRMAKTENYADADVAELDQNGKFIKIHPKPHTEKYPNAYRMRGVFILKKRILSFVPPNTDDERRRGDTERSSANVLDERRRGDTERRSANVPYEIGKQLLPDIVSRGEAFYGYECDDYSKGIDTLEKWKEVEDYLKTHEVSARQ